jgi:immune inhibitor A
MQRRTLILTALVVVSIAVVGVGGAAAATADSTQGTPQLQQTNATNTTDDRTAEAPPESQRAGEPPYPVDIPPNQLDNGSIDTSALPANLQSDGGYEMGTNVMSVERSKNGDAARQPAPEYEVGGPTLRWPSLDATAQSGPNDSSRYYFKNYTLKVVSPEVEIWVANDLSYQEGDPRPTPEVTQQQLLYLADEFTNNIEPKESQLYREPVPQRGTDSPLYPTDNSSGALPEDYYQSADNTSRTVLLVDNVRDQNYYDNSFPTYIAGFFSPTIGDLTDRNVMVIDSNGWDQRLGNQDAPWKQDEGDADNESAFGIESTTAHEYQHLLHSYADPGETSWINEGISEVTPYRVGYGLPSSIPFYERYPSNSLIQWEDQTDEAPITGLADYGAAGLFQLYGSQQFGTDFTQNVFSDDANGIQSVKNSLDDVGAERDFYSFYQDFSTALLVDDRNTTNERYQIENLTFDANTSEVIYTQNNRTAAYGNAFEPLSPESGSVDDLTVSGATFRGTPWTTVSDPPGEPSDEALYSTSGNNLDNNAVFSVDPTDSSTLTFDTYYDIERGWDYGFVQVSTDGGETWTSLSNENTTDFTASPATDEAVVNNLPGFTGDTNDSWVTEEFSLSEYADEGEVLISFRYITDGAAVQPGWYADDISVSGTDVSYDGSSTEPFESLREARENPFRYQFTVLGLGDGATEVTQYGPKTFEDNGSISLSSLPDGEFNRTILTTTWAPETTATGTVPYGYEVNPQTEGPPEEGGDDAENTLTIRGTGSATDYVFSVTDDLEKSTANDANINGNDEIRRGYVANGEVGISADSYTFSGSLETIKVSGDAEVLLNGERISDDRLDDYRNNVIEFAGSGSAAQYDFAATDADVPLEKVTANNANRNGGDRVFRTTANGEVGISKDAYGFNGVIDSLDIDGDANVYVNGRQVDPASEQDNMITIIGTGEAANYEFTVDSGDIAPSTANYANRNANDEANGATASGQVGISADSFDYNGDITSFDVSGADVQVYVDGEQIDQDDVASEA